MEHCYVILMHWPNVEYPQHEVTTLLGVTSTLLLAERAIANYCVSIFGEEDGNSLVCKIMPACTDARTYMMAKHYELKTATTFTVTEEPINNDWALM